MYKKYHLLEELHRTWSRYRKKKWEFSRILHCVRTAFLKWIQNRAVFRQFHRRGPHRHLTFPLSLSSQMLLKWHLKKIFGKINWNSIVLKENTFHICHGRKGLLPSGLSITSMLMMCTGTALVDPFVSKYARTWSYTFSSQVNIRSYLVLLSWKRSGFSFILIFLSRICNIPFSKKNDT